MKNNNYSHSTKNIENMVHQLFLDGSIDECDQMVLDCLLWRQHKILVDAGIKSYVFFCLVVKSQTNNLI